MELFRFSLCGVTDLGRLGVPPHLGQLGEQHLLVQHVHPLLPLDVKCGAHAHGRLLRGLAARQQRLQQQGPHTAQPGGHQEQPLHPQQVTTVQHARQLQDTWPENGCVGEG